MLFSSALRLKPKEVVAFVGAGGKTAAVMRLADELAHGGRQRVIVTTTTHLLASQAASVGALVRDDASTDLAGRVRAELAAHSPVVVVGQDRGERVAGLPPERIDTLAALDIVDAVLVEADGARMLPFKAPDAHEPVVPGSTTLLVPMVGISAIGAPLDDAHIHRPERVAQLTGAHLNDPVTLDLVARVLTHPEGGL